VERSNAWAARFRRLARDYEQLAETLAGLHFVAFAMLMLKRLIELNAWCELTTPSVTEGASGL
jgi:hypothetical protein